MIKPLSSHDRVFVLTGAGVSAESGLPTFRGADGLWRGFRVQDVATPEAFRANPEMVWQFYSERRKRHATVIANAAHFALAKLERPWGSASSYARKMSTPCMSRLARSASCTCTAG